MINTVRIDFLGGTMKKSVFILIAAAIVLNQLVYAENKSGTNKLGVYMGYPFGVSFSHNFTQKDQLDIQAAGIAGFPVKNNTSYIYTGGDFYVGYLRSAAEPIIQGVACPIEVGGGISFAPVMEQTYPNESRNFTVYIGAFFDVRWEIFFAKVPHLNLFLDISPGVYFNPTASRYNRHFALFTGRAGLSLRYVF